jgi:Domain of unknown function (DUF5666)
MKQHSMTITVAIACAVIFFFIGMAYGKGGAAPTARARGNFASSTRGGFAGRNGGGGFVAGQIVSVASGTMVVQMPNGNSANVFLSGSTQIIKPQLTSASALTPGTQVMVGGTTNADGSVSAMTIQIRTGSSTGEFGNRGGN